MKNSKEYLDRLISKVMLETLEDKANGIATKLNELGGMDDGHPRFGDKNFAKMTDAEIEALMNNDWSDEEDDEDYFGDDYNTDELEEDSEVCNECGGYKGGEFMEGHMCECGDNKMYEEDDTMELNPAGSSFDYVQEEDDTMEFEDNETEKDEENSEFCKYQKRRFGDDDKRYLEKCSGESAIKDLARRPISMNERLKGNQSKIDKNRNGKIDAEDFKMLRGKKRETEIDEKLYGKQSKIDKNHNGKIDSEDFKMLRKESDEKFIQKATSKMDKKGSEGKFGAWCKRNGLATEEGEVTKGCIDKAMKSDNPSVVKMANFAKNIKGYAGSKHKKSVKLSESEMIDLIERIVKEETESSKQTKNIKPGVKPRGLEKYDQVHKQDGKENDEYLKSVAKKMKDYLKDGSKGEYTTEPKMFPKGNGELAKMSKKAYVPSGAVEEFTDNLTAAGLENLSYDELHPNEEWVTKNIEGSSETGNNPEWANTGESDVNKKRNKIRKDNLLGKIKQKAYNKAPQPIVSDKSGEDEGDKLMAKLESIEPKQSKKINEEFDRMKKLMGYDKKTQ